MWISRKYFTNLEEKLAVVQVRLEATEEAAHADFILHTKLQAAYDEVCKARDFAVTSFEWMKTQLSQLTWERNKLMEQVTGVPARKLEFADGKRAGSPGKEESPGTGTALGEGSAFTPGTSFMDIGDEEAKRAGIDLKPALEEIEQFDGS